MTNFPAEQYSLGGAAPTHVLNPPGLSPSCQCCPSFNQENQMFEGITVTMSGTAAASGSQEKAPAPAEFGQKRCKSESPRGLPRELECVTSGGSQGKA